MDTLTVRSIGPKEPDESLTALNPAPPAFSELDQPALAGEPDAASESELWPEGAAGADPADEPSGEAVNSNSESTELTSGETSAVQAEVSKSDDMTPPDVSLPPPSTPVPERRPARSREMVGPGYKAKPELASRLRRVQSLVDEKLVDNKVMQAFNVDYAFWRLGGGNAVPPSLNDYLPRYTPEEFAAMGLGEARGLTLFDKDGKATLEAYLGGLALADALDSQDSLGPLDFEAAMPQIIDSAGRNFDLWQARQGNPDGQAERYGDFMGPLQAAPFYSTADEFHREYIKRGALELDNDPADFDLGVRLLRRDYDLLPSAEEKRAFLGELKNSSSRSDYDQVTRSMGLLASEVQAGGDVLDGGLIPVDRPLLEQADEFRRLVQSSDVNTALLKWQKLAGDLSSLPWVLALYNAGDDKNAADLIALYERRKKAGDSAGKADRKEIRDAAEYFFQNSELGFILSETGLNDELAEAFIDVQAEIIGELADLEERWRQGELTPDVYADNFRRHLRLLLPDKTWEKNFTLLDSPDIAGILPASPDWTDRELLAGAKYLGNRQGYRLVCGFGETVFEARRGQSPITRNGVPERISARDLAEIGRLVLALEKNAPDRGLVKSEAAAMEGHESYGDPSWDREIKARLGEIWTGYDQADPGGVYERASRNSARLRQDQELALNRQERDALTGALESAGGLFSPGQVAGLQAQVQAAAKADGLNGTDIMAFILAGASGKKGNLFGLEAEAAGRLGVDLHAAPETQMEQWLSAYKKYAVRFKEEPDRLFLAMTTGDEAAAGRQPGAEAIDLPEDKKAAYDHWSRLAGLYGRAEPELDCRPDRPGGAVRYEDIPEYNPSVGQMATIPISGVLGMATLLPALGESAEPRGPMSMIDAMHQHYPRSRDQETVTLYEAREQGLDLTADDFDGRESMNLFEARLRSYTRKLENYGDTVRPGPGRVAGAISGYALDLYGVETIMADVIKLTRSAVKSAKRGRLARSVKEAESALGRLTVKAEDRHKDMAEILNSFPPEVRSAMFEQGLKKMPETEQAKHILEMMDNRPDLVNKILGEAGTGLNRAERQRAVTRRLTEGSEEEREAFRRLVSEQAEADEVVRLRRLEQTADSLTPSQGADLFRDMPAHEQAEFIGEMFRGGSPGEREELTGRVLEALKGGQKGDSVNPDLAKFYENMEAYLKAHGQQLSGDVDWGMIGQYLDHLAANSPAEFEALIKRLPDETKLAWFEKNMAENFSPEQRRALANRRLDDPNLTDKIDRENWEKSGELSQLQDGSNPYHEKGASLYADGSGGSPGGGGKSDIDKPNDSLDTMGGGDGSGKAISPGKRVQKKRTLDGQDIDSAFEQLDDDVKEVYSTFPFDFEGTIAGKNKIQLTSINGREVPKVRKPNPDELDQFLIMPDGVDIRTLDPKKLTPEQEQFIRLGPGYKEGFSMDSFLNHPPGTKGELIINDPKIKPHERLVAEYLASLGNRVEFYKFQGQPGMKFADLLVNGVRVELKTLLTVEKATPDGLSRAISSRIADGRKQAYYIIIDTHKYGDAVDDVLYDGLMKARTFDKEKVVNQVLLITTDGPVVGKVH